MKFFIGPCVNLQDARLAKPTELFHSRVCATCGATRQPYRRAPPKIFELYGQSLKEVNEKDVPVCPDAAVAGNAATKAADAAAIAAAAAVAAAAAAEAAAKAAAEAAAAAAGAVEAEGAPDADTAVAPVDESLDMAVVNAVLGDLPETTMRRALQASFWMRAVAYIARMMSYQHEGSFDE